MESKPLNRDIIKYIAMFTMLLNHIANVFMDKTTFLAQAFIDIGYFTAITMCYFLVEGYEYTHSKKKYALRLLLFAFISEFPFCLAFSPNGKFEFVALNMMFTLFICFLIICVLKNVENKALKIILTSILTICTFICDWALFSAIFTILFVWAGKDKEKINEAYAVSAMWFILFNIMNTPNGAISVNSIILSFGTGVGIIVSWFVITRLYNGKRAEKGRTFSKWFFYLFYPVHILILGIIKVL